MQESREHIVLLISALTLVFLVAGGFLLLYVSLYNKRKKRHAEEKQAMQERFQKELIKTQMEVQEQTLQTIASDIHDNVGQLLSLAKLTLSSVNVNQPERTEQKVEQATSIVDSSIKELRQLAGLLHAQNLLAGGLTQAIENEVNWIGKTERFQIDWQTSGMPYRLEPERELIAFRLVQEVLNNIMKHADTTEIQLRLEYQPDKLQITISDNGKGFDVPAARHQSKGLGLKNFYNRAALIGGRFNLRSEATKGTTAILTIPNNL
jgi:two-component system, NarL family, sensor kinase